MSYTSYMGKSKTDRKVTAFQLILRIRHLIAKEQEKDKDDSIKVNNKQKYVVSKWSHSEHLFKNFLLPFEYIVPL